MNRPGYSSGTTANVVLIEADRLIVANAGDCRAVLSRGGHAVNLSVDHKPEDVEERRWVVECMRVRESVCDNAFIRIFLTP